MNSPPHNPTKPHPRTVLWFKQRKKCDTCVASRNNRCMLTRISPKQHAYCIDAREPGQLCGPQALYYVKKP